METIATTAAERIEYQLETLCRQVSEIMDCAERLHDWTERLDTRTASMSGIESPVVATWLRRTRTEIERGSRTRLASPVCSLPSSRLSLSSRSTLSPVRDFRRTTRSSQPGSRT